MALNLGELFVKIGGDTRGLERAERKVRQSMGKMDTSTRKASSGFKSMGLVGKASLIGIGIAAVGTVAKLTSMGDQFNALQQRIKTATKATGDYNKVSKELFDISQQTGTAIRSNVGMFQRLAMSSKELGATNADMLQLTKTLGQLGVIGGSTAEEMKNSLTQFAQGMSAGILRAEEYNSVVEGMPEVANRIAKGMGMSAGELRKAVVDGKVLSKDVFDVLLKQSEEINNEFSKIPKTMGQANTMLDNSMSKFAGQFAASTGLSTAYVNSLRLASDLLAGPMTNGIKWIGDIARDTLDHFRAWGDVISNMIGPNGFEAMSKVLGVIKSAVKEVLSFYSDLYSKIFKTFIDLPYHIQHAFKVAGIYVNNFGEAVGQLTKGIQLRFNILWLKVRDSALDAVGFIQKAWANLADKVVRYFAKPIADVLDAMSAMPFSEGLAESAQSLRDMANSTASIGSEIDENNRLRHIGIAAAKQQLSVVQAANSQSALSNELLAEQVRHTLKLTAAQNRRDQRRPDPVQEAASSAATISPSVTLGLGLGPSVDKVRKSLQGKIDALAESLSTEYETQMRHYENSIVQLAQAEQLKLDTIMPYQQMRERLEEEHQTKLNAIAEKYSKDRGRIGDIAAAFGVDIARKEGAGVLIAQGKAFEQQLDAAAQHSKEFFAIKKAMALATAMIEAPKAILSAYTFGSSMGGPILGAVFAGVASAATAVQIGAIASQNYGGGRAKGGGVNAGMMYQVNEKGPEMLSVGNKDFLMMGNKGGHVTPNNKLGGGGNKVVVNVYPRSGETAKVEQKETGDGMQIDVIIEAIEGKIAEGIQRGGSPVGDSMESQYGLNRSAGAIV